MESIKWIGKVGICIGPSPTNKKKTIVVLQQQQQQNNIISDKVEKQAGADKTDKEEIQVEFWNVCLSCNRGFDSYDKLQGHITVDHGGASTKVLICNQKDLTPSIRLKRCSSNNVNMNNNNCSISNKSPAETADLNKTTEREQLHATATADNDDDGASTEVLIFSEKDVLPFIQLKRCRRADSLKVDSIISGGSGNGISNSVAVADPKEPEVEESLQSSPPAQPPDQVEEDDDDDDDDLSLYDLVKSRRQREATPAPVSEETEKDVQQQEKDKQDLELYEEKDDQTTQNKELPIVNEAEMEEEDLDNVPLYDRLQELHRGRRLRRANFLAKMSQIMKDSSSSVNDVVVVEEEEQQDLDNVPLYDRLKALRAAARAQSAAQRRKSKRLLRHNSMLEQVQQDRNNLYGNGVKSMHHHQNWHKIWKNSTNSSRKLHRHGWSNWNGNKIWGVLPPEHLHVKYNNNTNTKNKAKKHVYDDYDEETDECAGDKADSDYFTPSSSQEETEEDEDQDDDDDDDDDDDANDGSSAGRFQCNVCLKVYNTKSLLLRHKKSIYGVGDQENRSIRKNPSLINLADGSFGGLDVFSSRI